jgi:hypothetical protein
MFGTFYNNDPDVLKRDLYVVKVNPFSVNPPQPPTPSPQGEGELCTAIFSMCFTISCKTWLPFQTCLRQHSNEANIPGSYQDKQFYKNTKIQ